MSEVQIFSSRADCLTAFTGSELKMFEASIPFPAIEDNPRLMVWGLAGSAHQFRQACIEYVANIKQIKRADVPRLMAEELAMVKADRESQTMEGIAE